MYASPVRPKGSNGLAVLAGVAAMLVGAFVWTIVAVATKHDYQIVAMAVGAIVGGAMYLARPSKRSMALVAGLFAFLGCAIGWFFVVGWLTSHDSNGSISLMSMLKLEAKHPRELYWNSMDVERYFFWLGGAGVAVVLTLRRTVLVGQATQRTDAIAPSFGGAAQGNQGYPAPQGYAGPPQGYQGPQGYGPPRGGPGYGPPQGAPQRYGPPQAGPQGYGPPQGGPGYGQPQGGPGYGPPQQHPPFQG